MQDQNERKNWLGLLAKADAETLTKLWADLNLTPEYNWLRTPEIGSVMARGRAGATGAPFNLGEVTVTRCSLQLATGEVGHGYVQGRDKNKSQLAALCDALLQSDMAAQIAREIIAPLTDLANSKREQTMQKAAKTKVDFFTLVRGED